MCLQFLNGSMKLKRTDAYIPQPTPSSPCQLPLDKYNLTSSFALHKAILHKLVTAIL